MLSATSRICARPVMHVSIVEERRNVLRRENTPAIRRNTRKGNRARICFYVRIFLVYSIFFRFSFKFEARNAVIFGQNCKKMKRATCHFPCSSQRSVVSLSESRGGLKFHGVISAKRYRLVSLNGNHNFNRKQTRLYTEL